MPFRSALSGINVAGNDLKVIGHNVANASTTGFKGSRAEFVDVYANAAEGASANAIGSGVRLASVKQSFGQGNIGFTDNKLDLAINGRGFLSSMIMEAGLIAVTVFLVSIGKAGWSTPVIRNW